MNPIEPDRCRGRSFKGLAKYLLHDAKEELGQHPATSQRVGWTQSINLMDAKPDKAWRLMASTAMSAGALKESAGIKKGGAKNTKPVYHYCITWPEGDQVNNDLQRKAVAESLAALKLDGHQALAVQHTDGKHPHVHVMVNLINPNDGTTQKLSYTKKNLRKWANKFEQTHGLKLTEGSRANEERRRNGEQVDARRKPRNVYEQEKQEGQSPRMAWLRHASNQNATTLQRDNRDMQQRHTAEWAAIKGTYHAHRDALRDDKQTAIDETVINVEAAYKAKWAALFKENRDRLEQFEKSEKSPALKLFNAATTFLQERKDKGFFSAIAAANSPEERRALVERKNKQAEERLGAEQKKESAGKVKQVKRDQDNSLTGARETFLEQCDEMKKTQQADHAEHRQKWREYRESRQQAHEDMTAKRELDHTQLLRQNESLQQHMVQTRDPN